MVPPVFHAPDNIGLIVVSEDHPTPYGRAEVPQSPEKIVLQLFKTPRRIIEAQFYNFTEFLKNGLPKGVRKTSHIERLRVKQLGKQSLGGLFQDDSVIYV